MNGDSYQGTMKRNTRDGEGRYVKSNQEYKISGKFNRGQVQGKVLIQYKQGQKYEGEVNKQGEIEGFGVLTGDNGFGYNG